MKKLLLAILVGAFLSGCSSDEKSNPLDINLTNRLQVLSPDGDLSYFILPDSDNYDAIPSGIGNPITQEKVALGKMLFFETGLAREAVNEAGHGTYSCASCHIPSAGFMPGRVQGIADGGLGFGTNGEGRTAMVTYEETELDVQGARPLSLLNVAYLQNTTWAGKFGAHGANEGTEHLWGAEHDPLTEINHTGLDGLEAQNIEGLTLHRMVINKEVMDDLRYTRLFDDAFPEFPDETRYSKLTASFAISAYLRTVLANEAPFQEWLKGAQEIMTEQQKRGALLFFSKAGCYRCHKGGSLNSNEFHALGVKDLYQTGEAFATSIDDKRNLGRGGFTLDEADNYKFRVPQIYNMKDSPFYFHGSSKRSLRELVEYFNEAIPENDAVPASQLSPYFHPLSLTEQEIEDLTAFLEDGLRDPNLNRYQPEFIFSGNCFPNNDPISRADLGCN